MNDIKPIKIKKFNWFQRRKYKKLMKELEQKIYNDMGITTRYFV